MKQNDKKKIKQLRNIFIDITTSSAFYIVLILLNIIHI